MKNVLLESKTKRPFLLDAYLGKDNAPLVIFCHGFKGFKDWGHFNLMADYFVEKGCHFVKFNFSHNGTTVDSPLDFDDLEAFGNNNFSIELDDLDTVLNWCEHQSSFKNNYSSITLIGHSRGGGIVVIKAAEDNRVDNVVTWNGVSEFENRFTPEEIEQWLKAGVIHVPNARTNQEMPLNIQLYNDFMANKDRLTISNAARRLTKPFLIVQGTSDEVVKQPEGEALHQWCGSSELLLIENGDHTFGAGHPFNSDKFPKDVQTVLDATIRFIGQ